VSADRLTIRTPERVTLEYEVAGLGSRFAAALVDVLIQGPLVVLLLGGVAALGWLSFEPLLTALERQTRGEPDALGALTPRFLATVGGVGFAVHFIYHAAFEGGRNGQTPGKRFLGLRVLMTGGHPLRPAAAVVRNLLRLVDFLPALFGLGLLATLLTPRTQRLGDLLARTLVVRERAAEAATALQPLAGTEADRSLATLELAPDERTLLCAFLERREELWPESRSRLAARLAQGLRRRHGDPGESLTAERYLERLAAERGP
jgi:uncharacterized RDD family membrane protein YckC